MNLVFLYFTAKKKKNPILKKSSEIWFWKFQKFDFENFDIKTRKDVCVLMSQIFQKIKFQEFDFENFLSLKQERMYKQHI